MPADNTQGLVHKPARRKWDKQALDTDIAQAAPDSQVEQVLHIVASPAAQGLPELVRDIALPVPHKRRKRVLHIAPA